MRGVVAVGIFLFIIGIVTSLPSPDEYEDVEVADVRPHEAETHEYNDYYTGPNNQDPVDQGDKIALQTFVRSYYASCASGHCGRSSCPHMDMLSNDWKRCWGEVFQIYRKAGSGIVRVGDFVGLYYPRERNWLGCAGQPCGKSTCPGKPNDQHGFANKNKWHACWGEVFRIFVKGKKLGAAVISDDEVAFFYPRSNRWVAVGFGRMVVFPCLGKHLPPKLGKYDGCAYETFRLWKKPIEY